MIEDLHKSVYQKNPIIFHKTGSGENIPDPTEWLVDTELSFFEQLTFQKRRDEWLLGRWTVKNLIKEVFEEQSQQIDFKRIEINRKPKAAPLLFIDGKASTFKISLSHRSGICFCITWIEDFAAGCDLEKIEPRSQLFIEDYFSEKERYFIINSDNEPLFANLFWSLKESVLKAEKSGLKIHPTKVEIFVELPWKHTSWNNAFAILNKVTYKGFWNAEKGYVRTIMGDINKMKIHRISG